MTDQVIDEPFLAIPCTKVVGFGLNPVGEQRVV
jgi:hypothetical protein